MGCVIHKFTAIVDGRPFFRLEEYFIAHADLAPLPVRLHTGRSPSRGVPISIRASIDMQRSFAENGAAAHGDDALPAYDANRRAYDPGHPRRLCGASRDRLPVDLHAERARLAHARAAPIAVIFRLTTSKPPVQQWRHAPLPERNRGSSGPLPRPTQEGWRGPPRKSKHATPGRTFPGPLSPLPLCSHFEWCRRPGGHEQARQSRHPRSRAQAPDFGWTG